MSDKKSTNSRRKVLKTVVAGSGAIVAGKSLPEGWTKPVVNAVMLPAHAATTPGAGTGDGTDVYPGCVDEGLFCDGLLKDNSVFVDNAAKVIVTNQAWVKPIQNTTLGADGKFSVTAAEDIGDGTITVSGFIPCGAILAIAVVVDGDADDYTLDACL